MRDRRANGADRRLFHSGTDRRSAVFDGPKYTASFVAQALGQVLADTTKAASSSLAAYRKRPAFPGLFFDTGA
jgi:hypothetical protein